MLGIRDGVIQFFRSKNFCLTVPKNFVGEPFCAVFQKISGIEKSMEKRGGGEQRFSAEIYLSHRAEKFRRGTLLCFTEFLVSKIFLERKGLGEYQEFPSKYFCLTLPKNFVGERFCDVFKKNSGSEKAFRKKRGQGVSRFSVKNFLSHSAEKFLRGTLLCCVSETFC